MRIVLAGEGSPQSLADFTKQIGDLFTECFTFPSRQADYLGTIRFPAIIEVTPVVQVEGVPPVFSFRDDSLNMRFHHARLSCSRESGNIDVMPRIGHIHAELYRPRCSLLANNSRSGARSLVHSKSNILGSHCQRSLSTDTSCFLILMTLLSGASRSCVT